MAFKARKVKGGKFEIVGLEQYLDKRLLVLERRLGLATKHAATKRTATKTKAPKRTPLRLVVPDALDRLVAALESHPRRKELVKAGLKKDQLLRSLIPLYLLRHDDVEVTSGITSKFWALHGVKYLAPNAAKALREHTGYAKQTKKGRHITSTGVKYVDTVLKARKAA